ncbi:MAG TPA: cohesin domain-containing protein [Thermoanaerobaculia bacterium]|nr:cohesin domain-containing protein [Thermoanaerobaculia bacterium]
MRLVALAAVFLLTACGGGGGNGPTGPPPTTPQILFSPASVNPTNAIALADGVGTDANNLFLDVRAATVQGLYGVSFDLKVPALLRFTGRTQGTFLSAGGVQTSFQVIENPTGNLVIGLTRLGGAAGVDGSGLLMTLQFSASTAGTGAFEIQNGVAVDETGQRLSTSFAAGSVQVIR